MNTQMDNDVYPAVSTSRRYDSLEARYLPGAYQELIDWLVLIAILAGSANIVLIAGRQPSLYLLLPIMAILWLGHWILGAWKVSLPQDRGIISLQDVATAILEKRRPRFGVSGLVRHCKIREVIFALIILINLAVCAHSVEYLEHIASAAGSDGLIGEVIMSCTFLVLMPFAYTVFQGQKRASLVGAMLACALLLFVGGFIAVGVGSLSDAVTGNTRLVNSKDTRDTNHFVDNIVHQFDHQ